MKVIKSGGKDFIGEATKLEGVGKIKFKLFVDDNYELHVQLQKNDTGGKCSDLLFLVSEFSAACKRKEPIVEPRGYDIGKKKYRCSKNTVDPGFLKSVLRHLLPDGE